MTRPMIFVSYSHKDEVEKEALLAQLGVLGKEGLLEIWNDDRIGPGRNWEKEIAQAISQASIAILLITANFLNSDFILVREVPELLKRRQREGLTIFPVIARACPWRRVAWLAQMNVRPKNGNPIWHEGGRFVDDELTRIAEEVADLAITDVSEEVMVVFEATPDYLTGEVGPVELPESRSQIDPEPPYGIVPADSNFYIERVADENCWRYITSPHAATLFIQASRQVGKSSLMRRMIHRAEKRLNQRSIFIDFQEVSKTYFTDTNEENFLIEFCLMMGRALDIPEAIDQYWHGRGSNTVKCGIYLSKHILPKVEEPFILALDEVDRLLFSPFHDSFFGMLRVWHNRRAYDEQFRKVNLFLSSSTESSLLIASAHQSPFNVATHISLQDFTQAEVEELNKRHHFPLSQQHVNDLMTLINGHPFLTRVALFKLAIQEVDVKTLFAQATSHTGPFGDHLRHLPDVLYSPEIKQAMLDICRYHTHEENDVFYHLKGAGLIKRVGKQILPRNMLYARYFQERLK